MGNSDGTKFIIGGILAASIMLGASQHTNNSNDESEKETTLFLPVASDTSRHNELRYFIPDGYHLEGNTIKKDITITAPEGFHIEKGSKIVKNPKGLVDVSFIPKAGYHLEQYDYDNNLFYVIQDGYHNENGYLIQDGWHLEGNTIKKDITITAPEGFHIEKGSKIVKNPKGLVDVSFIPKAGYHLEQYDYDNNLFYVIQDGYHNENGYLIQDGWHLEGNTIKKDIVEVGFSRVRKLK